MTNASFAGYAVALSVSGVFSLPPASTSIGLTYILENRYGVTIQIRPNISDTIATLGLSAGNDVVLSDKGDVIELRAISGNIWQITRNVGFARPLGFERAGRIFSKGTLPTSGFWIEGDTINNNAATRASPVSSRKCVLAGVPGVWAAVSWVVFIGSTGQRPILSSGDIGVQFLDLSLASNGKPIYWSGSNWVDSLGAPV